MTATVTDASVLGFPAVVLDNRLLRAVILPTLGGRVWELTDKVRNRQWIWHRPDVPLAVSPLGASYDDVWAGGWEELFPNDAPATFDGRALPDHGEWWTLAWSVDEARGGADAVVRLVAQTEVRRTACVKEFRLAAEGDELEVLYRIDNLEAQGFAFLFKQHLPVSVTPGCRLVLPGGVVTAVDPAFGTLLPGGGPHAWAEAKLDRIGPAAEAAREFVYVEDLPAAWCGVDDPESGASLRLRYDRDQLPFVWLFLTYGGWRDCYTAVLEPCTNKPKDLAEAVRRGRAASITAGGRFETRVAVALRGMGED